MYSVKEIYYTLQGEGAHTGRPSVFCRFAGCNLWSGLEKDRSKAICNFCDTDFVGTDGEGGGKFKTPEELSEKVLSVWCDSSYGKPYVVCTGGEPLLQLDEALINAFHKKGFKVAVETNGTIEAPNGVDWLCVSPKANQILKQTKGNELKLVYPQTLNSPKEFEDLNFDYFYLQPMDGLTLELNLSQTITYCLENPQWRLSLQTHKYIGLR
jgi:7-carboxy-7-deazaguanine synthase